MNEAVMPVIGREPPADIVVPAPQVSARHAEIRHLGGDLYEIVDLGSTNGTYVRDARVQSANVRLDDPVRLGSFPIDLRAFANRIPRVETGTPVQATPKPVVPAPRRLDPSPAPSVSPAEPISNVRRAEPSPAPASVNNLSAALAAQKSFVGKAFLVWFLYWLFWIPGFVMNLAYLSEANRVKAMAGRSPSGRGCLVALLWIYVALPLVFIVLLVVFGTALIGSLSNMVR